MPSRDDARNRTARIISLDRRVEPDETLVQRLAQDRLALPLSPTPVTLTRLECGCLQVDDPITGCQTLLCRPCWNRVAAEKHNY